MNDPETGAGAPTVVVKLIVYVVMVSACAGPATTAIKLNAPARANFMVLMVCPLDDANPRIKRSEWQAVSNCLARFAMLKTNDLLRLGPNSMTNPCTFPVVYCHQDLPGRGEVPVADVRRPEHQHSMNARCRLVGGKLEATKPKSQLAINRHVTHNARIA